MTSKLFDSFNKMNVLIIGDVMIDAYLWGKVERISPEAPVPIVSVTKKENRMGGAANVALNIKAMGASPILCSVIGDDDAGKEFLELMKNENISTGGIIKVKDRPTTVKTRVIGHHQQILRIDEETEKNIKAVERNQLAGLIKDLLTEKKIDVIIFEDYDKGVISPELIEEIVLEAQKLNIPTVVDPKKKNFLQYKKVSLFKPNLKELKEGLKIDFDHHDRSKLSAAVKQLRELIQADYVMVTLSEMGVFISGKQGEHLIPAHIRNIADVSGAGDTVVSVAALALASGLAPEKVAALANLAGGLVCEKVGVVPIDKEQLQLEAKGI